MRMLLALLLTCVHVYAHGCGGFRGRSGGPPPPGRRFDCRCGDCRVCTPLSRRVDPRVRTMRDVQILERSGEMARVLVRVGFRTRAEGTALPAIVRVRLGARFAVTKATLRREGRSLEIGRAQKKRKDKACLLVRPINSSTVELRVYPVATGSVTWALLEGVALLPDLKRIEPRIYRAGPHFLAVGPGTRTVSLDRGPDPIVADFALLLLTHERSVLSAGNVKLWVAVGPPAVPPRMHEPFDPVPPPPPPPQNPPVAKPSR